MATPRKDPEPFKTDLFSSPLASSASLSLGMESFSSPLSLAPALTTAHSSANVEVKKVSPAVFHQKSLGGSPGLASGTTPPSRHSPQPAERKAVGMGTISLDDLSTVPLDSPSTSSSGPPVSVVGGVVPLRSATDPAMIGTTNLHGWNDPPPLSSFSQSTPLRAAATTASAEPSLDLASDPFAFQPLAPSGQTNASSFSGLSTTPPTNASLMTGPTVSGPPPPPSSSSSSSTPSQQQLSEKPAEGGANPYRIGVGFGSRKAAYATSSGASYGSSVAPPPPGSQQVSPPPPQPFTPSPAPSLQPPTAAPPSQPSLLPTFTPSQDWSSSSQSASIKYHWFYLRSEEKYWIPFSVSDSNNLENAFLHHGQNTTQEVLVATDGGRYDVDLLRRQRNAVYWEEPASFVRRCSWFFKGEGDRWYLPYDENTAARLEEEFTTAMSQASWNRRVELGSGEAVVMHSHSAIVHYPTASSQFAPYSPSEDTATAPKSVMRGFAEIDKVEPGEQSRVDHVVFVVHGIGAHCDLNFRSLVDCVDDFREVAQLMLKTHTFSQQAPREGDGGGRVEFLPVHWHAALHGEDTGVDCRLKPLTLPSISRLRDFTNSTLLDILFYASPIFCQTIVSQVASEMNRMLAIFKTRNPAFRGGVSVMGHSLGSCVLFDILDHQPGGSAPQQTPPTSSSSSSSSSSGLAQPLGDPLLLEGAGGGGGEEEEEGGGGGTDEPDDAAPSLEDALASVGLSELCGLLQSEKIDYDSLLMLSGDDLKELGMAMGHRKKLASLIAVEAERQRLAEEQKLQEKQAHQKAQSQETVDGAVATSSVQGVKFVRGMAGTGQPFINYPQLDFEPQHLFCVGSPIGLFLSVRGVEELGPNFCLPTCPNVLNIFHPFDPVAYRLEPLVCDSPPEKPLLMPHHKGRKRFHLELYENLGQVGASIKHHLMEGMRNMWSQLNEIARSHTAPQGGIGGGGGEGQLLVQNEVELETPDLEAPSSLSVAGEAGGDGSLAGRLNHGRRIDHVLQEKPIEKLNQYIFALSSHLCYWRSEDTALFILKEAYNEPNPELVKTK